jgi:signal transduction histidine kinase
MATAHAVDTSVADRDTGPQSHESVLLPVVSRALRGSLQVIVGFAELLRDPNLEAEDREAFVSRIGTEAETLLQRIESGALRSNEEEDAILIARLRRSMGRRHRLPRWLTRPR